MELVYENNFDAERYPDLKSNEALLAEVAEKVKSMRMFMDKMKGGVRTMRSIVSMDGQDVQVVLKI